MERLRVGVVYGGRSSEHEVSLASAAAVIAHLDPARIEAVPVYIDRDGRWTLPPRPPGAASAAETIQAARAERARPLPAAAEVYPLARPGRETLLQPARADATQPGRLAGLHLDVVFPVLHGPYGEDGTIQGLLELANVPYVGSGVLGSALAMDKAVAKVVCRAAGLAVTDFVVLQRRTWLGDPAAAIRAVTEALDFPVFVKPVNLGSSIGVSRAADEPGLRRAIDLAASFDRKVLVERAVPAAREIECAVLGNDRPEVSVVGEIEPSREFYDYEAKYLDDGSRLIIPAGIPPDTAEQVRRMAAAAFTATECAGMARVDFLLARGTDALYLNEINTIPGFTTISMYAKLWAATGVSYPALLDRLIVLALERHREKQALRTSPF